MDIIVWLITLFLLLLPANTRVQTTAPAVPIPPTPTLIPGDSMVEVPTVIEQVDALLLGSFPVQVQLHVTGYQPDGCEVPLNIEQQRDGNQVSVRIYRLLPADVMCPMMIVPYDDTIRLEGGFESGTYTIDVNGITTEVRI